MELRQLRHFVAVAEAGNISRAARKIFLTQPALSRQIKALEEELGLRVFERQAHAVRLTPAGEILLGETRELLARADLLVARVRDAGRGRRLRVGYAPSLAAGLLAVAVNSFTQAHPQARVELADLSSQEMLAGLEADTLDVAITLRRAGAARGLAWTPLWKSGWSLAVGRGHALATVARPTKADVAAQAYAIFQRREFPEYWDIFSRWVQSVRPRPRIAGEYDGAESLMAAVEAGLGVALVPNSIGRLFPERVVLKPLAAPPAPLHVHAGYRAERRTDRPLMVFVEELRAAARHLG